MSEQVRKIVTYSNDLLRPFIGMVEKSLKDSDKIFIPYDFWKNNYLPTIAKNADDFGVKVTDFSKPIRYTTVERMLEQFKGIESQVDALNERILEHPEDSVALSNEIYQLEYDAFVPVWVKTIDTIPTIDSIPVWFGNTSKGISMFIGPKDFDMSQPYSSTFNDDNPHGNVQGVSGSGKSTLMHDLIVNLSMLYPPWELDLQLIDNKIAEFHVYGKMLRLPQATVVAATNSKEFLLDLYDAFREKNQDRQILFNKVGVNGISNLRKKFDLTIPQVLFLVDELIAMLNCIRDTASDGNDRVADEIKEIFSALQKIATLGRNAGVHMLLSSQDLGSQLDSGVANQLTSGIVLQGTREISNSCINNPAGETICKKGVCFSNTHRIMGDNDKYNVTCGVPFIDSTPVLGKLNQVEDSISKLAQLATEYGFEKDFFYYDANRTIPYREYLDYIKTSISKIESDKELYQLILPVGKEIKYRDSRIIACEMHYKSGEGFIIDAKTNDSLKYMFRLLYTTVEQELSSFRPVMIAYYSSKLILETLGIEDSCPVKFRVMNKLPEQEMNIFHNRLALLRLNESLLNTPDADAVTIFRAACKVWGTKLPDDEKVIDCLVQDNISSPTSIPDEFKDKYPPKQLSDWITAQAFANMYVDIMSKIDGTQLRPYHFQPRLLYWFDLQDIQGITDVNKSAVLEFFRLAPMVGIINVVNSSTWADYKFAGLFELSQQYVIEFSTKSIFSNLGLGEYTANVNLDSVVVHDRVKKDFKYTKNFGGI